jgi:predicted Zn-dependent protease
VPTLVFKELCDFIFEYKRDISIQSLSHEIDQLKKRIDDEQKASSGSNEDNKPSAHINSPDPNNGLESTAKHSKSISEQCQKCERLTGELLEEKEKREKDTNSCQEQINEYKIILDEKCALIKKQIAEIDQFGAKCENFEDIQYKYEELKAQFGAR